MHSINVVLRNLQEVIKSDKWGRGSFCRAEFHVTSVISSIAEMGFSKHTVAAAQETLATSLKREERRRL